MILYIRGSLRQSLEGGEKRRGVYFQAEVSDDTFYPPPTFYDEGR